MDLTTGRRSLWKELASSDPAGFVDYGTGASGVLMTPDGLSFAYTYWSSLPELYLVEGLK